MKQSSVSTPTVIKKVRRTEASFLDAVSRIGASSELKYSEPASLGASQAQSQKRRIVKTRLKKIERDSGVCESMIHAIGSGFSF